MIKNTISSFEENTRTLLHMGVDFSYLILTETGLKKSILDATIPVRSHFQHTGFHNYYQQGQGSKYKEIRYVHFHTEHDCLLLKMSLYRPETKQGDPRLWLSRLPHLAQAGQSVGLIIHQGELHCFNLTTTPIWLFSEIVGYVSLKQLFVAMQAPAQELLHKLKCLARQPLQSLRAGDTGIGFTLETHLGITANSSKQPDYKGIEIKTKRNTATSRSTLFAQVADWSLSPCNSSAIILQRYGYAREEDFKLYCTIRHHEANSQGLFFIYDEKCDQLQEHHTEHGLVAIWPGQLLRNRLQEKHKETFWINADRSFVNDIEYFQLQDVTHTKSPMINQFFPLIQSGKITMDHLIKRQGKTGRVSEKGPLFKLNKKDLHLLFPQSDQYGLSAELQQA